jgi:hypothetical protein
MGKYKRRYYPNITRRTTLLVTTTCALSANRTITSHTGTTVILRIEAQNFRVGLRYAECLVPAPGRIVTDIDHCCTPLARVILGLAIARSIRVSCLLVQVLVGRRRMKASSEAGDGARRG